LSSTLHSLKTKVDIHERRKQVACLLARATSEREIAYKLGVNQSTISRDIKAMKAESQQFVFDLAKSDLSFYYKQSLQGILEAKKEAWEIYNNPFVSVKERLLAVKIIMQADETRFKLLSEGPSVLAVQNLQERISRIFNRPKR
jgi:IS30 family transposase